LTFFNKPTISLCSFFLSYYFSSCFIYPFFLNFVPHYIYIFHFSQSSISVVISLMNSSFTSFLFIPFLYFTFLSLLTSLNFHSNFHITNIHAMSSINQYVIYLVTCFIVRGYSGDLVNVLILILCSCHC